MDARNPLDRAIAAHDGDDTYDAPKKFEVEDFSRAFERDYMGVPPRLTKSSTRLTVAEAHYEVDRLRAENDDLASALMYADQTIRFISNALTHENAHEADLARRRIRTALDRMRRDR